MKRLLVLSLAVAFVFLMGSATFASNSVEGPLDSPLNQDIPVDIKIGGYVHVMAQRLEYDHSSIKWNWKNWRFEGGHFWDDNVDPLMDFGEFSGKAGQGKFTDSNGFVVETNTSVTLTFEGIPLTHTEDSDSKMLTTYWAFTAAGVEETWPVPEWRLFPAQVVPLNPIGFFGEGKVPRYDGGFSYGQVFDGLLHLIGAAHAWDIWPSQSDVELSRDYNGITTNGIYAFQVFGFAGTDDISSQREGDYTGKIILTVSK